MKLSLGLGLAVNAIASEPAPPPTDFQISNDDVDENSALGTVVGTFSAVDPDAGEVTFSLIDDADMFEINGADLVVIGVPDFEATPTITVTARATGSQGGTLDQEFIITIDDVAEDPPEEPPGDIIVDDPDNFDIPPIVVEVDGQIAFNGKKKANGTSGKFIMDIGSALAGHDYMFTYTPDFSRLANDGVTAMVGFGLRSGNDFHAVGLKGNGSNDVNAYQISGENKWNQTTGFTTTDEGAAIHGSLAGPNHIRFRVSVDGETYSFATSNDGVSWSDEVTVEDPTPLSSVTSPANFGIIIFLDSNDAGVFRVDGVLTIEQYNDPHIANVGFLCGFNGVDGATSATDESPIGNTITFTGNAQIDTAQSKFGGASLLLDGTGDRVSTPAGVSDEFDFGAGDFTIECWVRFATLDANSHAIMSRSGAAANTIGWSFRANSADLDDLWFGYSSDAGATFGNVVTTSGAGITTGVWYHVAVDRDSSDKIRIYVDGVMRGSGTPGSATINNEGNTLVIGGGNDIGTVDTSGWFDEVRITKGVARYASDSGFTAPTKAFPRV